MALQRCSLGIRREPLGRLQKAAAAHDFHRSELRWSTTCNLVVLLTEEHSRKWHYGKDLSTLILGSDWETCLGEEVYIARMCQPTWHPEESNGTILSGYVLTKLSDLSLASAKDGRKVRYHVPYFHRHHAFCIISHFENLSTKLYERRERRDTDTQHQ